MSFPKSLKSLFRLPRNVYILGFFSLLNDLSSGVITPLLVAILSSLELGPRFLGLMEGLASGLSYAMMLVSGLYSDKTGQNKKLTLGGYFLCSIARLFFVVPIAGVMLAARLLDRIGKGLRTTPRDRLLTESLEKKDWGKGFGLQRAMDHAGDFLSIPVSILLLSYTSLTFKGLVFWVGIPTLVLTFLVSGLLEEPQQKTTAGRYPIDLSFKKLPVPLKRYYFIIFLTAFSAAPELFLILKAQELGLSMHWLPLAWGTIKLPALIATLLGGYLADHWGQRRTIALGWTIFAIVYVGLAWNTTLFWIWPLLVFHGVQSGLVEASERAYPAQMISEELRGTAIGWYYLAYGAGLLPASILFGFLWYRFGSEAAFLIYACMTLIAIPMLAWLPSAKNAEMRPNF